MDGLITGGKLLTLACAALIVMTGAEITFKESSRISPNGGLLIAQRGPETLSRGRISRGVCSTSQRGSITVNATGSYSALTEGQVEVLQGSRALASGSVGRRISTPTGCVVTIRVRLTGLVDQPTVTLRSVSLQPNQLAQQIPVRVETGLVRVQATRGGRRISGVARFHRINAQGQPEANPVGTLGATGSSSEISAGRYEVRLPHSGQTLRATVNVTAGSSRLVELSAP